MIHRFRSRFLSAPIARPQIHCHLLHTNERIRDLVRANIDRSPLFNGQIQGIGPRYCPSLEDKIVRFPDKERHQIFLEPEGVDAREIYVNGFSMSLPRRCADRSGPRAPWARGRGASTSGLRDRVRLHPTDRAHQTAGDQTRRRPLPRGSDQRYVRLRGGRRAGPDCGCERGLRVSRWTGNRTGSRRGVHRHPDRRPDYEGMPRAVPDVHVASRTSVAAPHRQR